MELVRRTLESHFKDMQDFEFTIEDGELFMLQTRNGKRTGLAAVRIACEMVKEKLITWETAVTRVPAEQLDQVLAPVFDRAAVKAAKVIAKGLPAGPGAATGKIYFNADRAVQAAENKEKSPARAGRDFTRGFARDDRGRGHFNRPWRRQLPRGARRPADGQSLRLRRERVAGGLRGEDTDGGRPGVP